jgi:hypothetical protein
MSLTTTAREKRRKKKNVTSILPLLKRSKGTWRGNNQPGG